MVLNRKVQHIMKLSGARILIETLIEQGAEVIFGYPGGAVLNIYDELYLNSDRIKHIITGVFIKQFRRNSYSISFIVVTFNGDGVLFISADYYKRSFAHGIFGVSHRYFCFARSYIKHFVTVVVVA